MSVGGVAPIFCFWRKAEIRNPEMAVFIACSFQPQQGKTAKQLNSNTSTTMTPTQHLYRYTPSRDSPSNELAQSSMVQRNASPVKENAPTDGEWFNVAQVLSTLRGHTLQATPAFTTRYAKQTTDIDVWAWKQTTNWENRKTIRKYLNKIDLDQAAASNADFAARFKMSGEAQAATRRTARPNHREEHEAQHRHRPRSAPMRRNNRNGQHRRTSHGPHVSRPQTATVRCTRNKQYRTQISSPTDRWTTATATATATTVLSTPKQRRLQPPSQPQRQRRHPQHFQQHTRHISQRQTNTQTAGQWVVGLAQGKATRSPGKQYTISRRRQRKFANVNHKDKLMLEKLTFRTRMKRINDTNAAKSFQRRNGMV